jgi:myo-inositol 2-dehydrogenase/D-chiro-inositol 1-dehydrogenase
VNLAKRNARIFGAKAIYTDVDEMLNTESLDGVLVVGPEEMHYIIGQKVLSCGIPLFIEKPPAPTLEKTQELVDLARKNNTFVMTGFMKRHGLTYKKIRDYISEGCFKPAAGFFRYSHWAGSRNLEGTLLGMCIHPIDLAISFFGDVAEVISLTSESDLGLSLGLTLRFCSGLWAQLMLGSSVRIQERVEISGKMDEKDALFTVDNVQHLELHTAGQPGIDLWPSELYEIKPVFDLDDIKIWRPDYGIPNMGQNSPWLLGYAGEIREFATAILEKREPYPGTEDALKAMEVIKAVISNPNGTTILRNYLKD